MIKGILKSFLIIYKTISVFLFGVGVALSANAVAPSETPPGSWRGDFWRMSVFTDYYSSNSNLSSSGTRTFSTLPPGNKVQVYAVRPKLRYNFSEKSSLYFGGNIVNTSSVTGSVQRNNSGLGEAFVGMNYILSGQFSRLVGELEADYAATPYSATANDALLSDGANSIRAQFYFFRPYSFGNPFVHLGAQYRDQGYSQLILYGGGFEKPLGKSFLIGTGFEGELSFLSDTNSSIYRSALTDQVMGGSHYFAAYNPSFIDARIWAGYKPEPGWQFKLGYAQSFLGTNASYGQSFFLSFSLNFDPRADDEGFAQFRQSKSSARRKGQKDLNDFEPEKNNINPELYKDEQRFEPLD